MKRIILVLLLVLFALPAFAVTVPDDGYTVPHRIINNQFYLESLRLNALALETFEFGDYVASRGFAEEAIRFAYLSNEFVSEQLIGEAQRLLSWAQSSNFAVRNASEYNESRAYYETSVAAHSIENWEVSISSAISSIEIMWRFAPDAPAPPPASTTGTTTASTTGTGAIGGTTTGTTGTTTTQRTDGLSPLPSQYRVRTWENEKDCLWTIAGYPWVYNDPWQWRRLYEANRSRLPDPNNPDLIEPGMILEIPSIRGEQRQGTWEPNRTYSRLP